MINYTTSRPGVFENILLKQIANLNGDYEIPKGAHTHKNAQATMGKLKGIFYYEYM